MRVLYLILIVLAGVILNAPYHNFQNFLAQGDHGRDLYAAQAVLRGELPYKDFWWVYGPLMPYYYGAFFKILGIKITSILLGKIALNIFAGVFCFLALAVFFSPLTALAAAIWFMFFHQDFFFTYNHAGGIALMMAAIWMHCAYLKSSRANYAWGALAFVFVLGFIKINFAITTLLMTVLCVAVKDRKNKRLFFTSALLFIPLLWFGIYAWFTQGLTIAEIRQCLPYLGSDEPYSHLNPLQTFPMLIKIIWFNIRANYMSRVFCFLVIVSSLQTLYMLFKKKIDPSLVLLFIYAMLFYALNLHEFLKSGVYYRCFWSQPLSILLSFSLIAFAASTIARKLYNLLWIALIVIVGLLHYDAAQMINTYKNPQHFLGSARGGVYITNDRSWIQTVVLTTKQLSAVLKKDDLFLALPYDCLYYYLTDKKSPTRQLIFFDHIKIAADQEQKIIAELEHHKIAAVLLSSRQSAHEPGLGTLGVSYCPLMAQYITNNFTPVAKIGDWEHEPGWAWNHGTLIFKRK